MKSLKHFNFSEDFINWIRLFYSNATSCVINNGFQSEFFPVKHGVLQGCPLSPYLFIICMELLTYQIRINKNIKGITIAGCELKNTCYADDASFILGGSKRSFETLIDILENFSFISGLKLNPKKCQVLRIGVTNDTNIVYLEKTKFQWSSYEAKALGMVFSTNKERSLKFNLDSKTKQFETCLKQWQHRKLTLMGKITVIKTFALPKLIFALSALPNPSSVTINHIEKIMYAFIWDNKPEKIKQNTLIQKYEAGGIKMVDIRKFIQSLLITWIKRLLAPNSNSFLKKIYISRLNNFDMDLYFECDIHKKDIQANFKDNAFLTDVLIACSKMNKKHATVYYSNEILWNNSNIKAGNRTLLYKKWLQTGIKYIKDIYDYSLKKIYSFEELTGLYNLPRTDFLKYIRLVQSIPNHWKAQLKQENRDVFQAPIVFDQLQKAKQTNKL